jgi:hypothetical protein
MKYKLKVEGLEVSAQEPLKIDSIISIQVG